MALFARFQSSVRNNPPSHHPPHHGAISNESPNDDDVFANCAHTDLTRAVYVCVCVVCYRRDGLTPFRKVKFNRGEFNALLLVTSDRIRWTRRARVLWLLEIIQRLLCD